MNDVYITLAGVGGGFVIALAFVIRYLIKKGRFDRWLLKKELEKTSISKPKE